MFKLVVPALVALSMVAAPAAFAATPASASKATSASTKHASGDPAKEKACRAQWKGEKKHSQTRAAFMKACEA